MQNLVSVSDTVCTHVNLHTVSYDISAAA